VWELRATPAELDALKQRCVISGTARRGGEIVVRVVADTAPTATARPAAPTLEDAYLLHQASAPSPVA